VTAAARARELDTAEPVLVHELAHQWFGDDIAPAEWSDVWLNEGHATWYEAKWADEKFGISFVDRMHAAYIVGNQYRADFGPVARPSSSDLLELFSDNVSRNLVSAPAPGARAVAPLA
jgi:aminopeptidase N